MVWMSNMYSKLNMSKTDHSDLPNLLYLQLLPSDLMASPILPSAFSSKILESFLIHLLLFYHTFRKARNSYWLFLQNISKIQLLFTMCNTITLAWVTIISHLDYYNILLINSHLVSAFASSTTLISTKKEK